MPAMEVIVVDDGSSDESQQFVRKNYEHVRLLTQVHLGVSAARNKGIREASGDWIALLDSDDMWLPEKLKLQYEALQNNKEYLVAHTNEAWVHNGEPLKQMKKHRKHGGNIFQYCLPLCVISPSSVIIHRNVFDKVGMFNEHYPVCEDYDMWLRVCCHFPVLFLDKTLIVKFGGHQDQLSHKYWGMDRFRIQALADILETSCLNTSDREAVVETILKKITIYLNGARKHGNKEMVAEFNALKLRYCANAAFDSQAFRTT